MRVYSTNKMNDTVPALSDSFDWISANLWKQVQSLVFSGGMSGWLAPWTGKRCEASSSAPHCLRGGVWDWEWHPGLSECDIHAFRTRNQSRLMLPPSPVPRAQTQTRQVSEGGMGCSCRQEKPSISAWLKDPQASPPKAPNGPVVAMDNCAIVK